MVNARSNRAWERRRLAGMNSALRRTIQLREQSSVLFRAMTRFKFRAAFLAMMLMGSLAYADDTKSKVEQLAQATSDTVQKAKDGIKDTANRTEKAVKDTANKAAEAGRRGVEKASEFATNIAEKGSSLATNVAAKTRVGAQKVESATTNLVDEIKQKVH